MTALPPDTRIGSVHLTVRDLALVSRFYAENLGLERLGGDAGLARLGVAGEDVVVLHAAPDAPRVTGTTGLYHLAILLPSRADLGRWLAHLNATGTRLKGAADHLVSEALYLADPEGNGIEIYRDRPPHEWPREPDGTVRMASDPIDVDALIADGGTGAWSGLPAGTRMGHVHLRVSDIAASEAFYVGVLGFEVMARWDSALFVAAGGYHHHVGMNTWGGVGAPPPSPGAQGLREFTVLLPDRAACERVVERVARAGVPVKERPDGFALVDPSSNPLVLATHAAAPSGARAR